MWDQIQAVTFDLDGVLVDSESVNIGSAFGVFAEFGVELQPADVAAIVGRHPIDYLPAFGERHGFDAAALERIRARQGRLYVELWERTAAPIDGALGALEQVEAAGLPIALATSGGRRHVERCLDQFGFGRFFRVVLTKDDVARRKPDPEVYLASARGLGVDPASMLVVEDSEYGVRAAVAAGASCVAVRNGHTAPDRLCGARAVIDGVGQLAELLGLPAARERSGVDRS